MKRKSLRLWGLLAVGLAMLAMPASAHADPATVAFALLDAGFSAEVALAAASAVEFVGAYSGYLAAANAVYGGMDARRRARHAAQDARNAYNAGLADRNVTILSAEAPLRYVYGDCVTGGALVATLTTDKLTVGDDGVTTVAKPDAYKHLVIVVAAREITAIDDVLIEGVSVGMLDAEGWAQSGELSKTGPVYREISLSPGQSITFTGTPPILVSANEVVNYAAGDPELVATSAYTVTNGGLTFTSTHATNTLSLGLNFVTYERRVRVSKFLGAPGQVADPYLRSVAPTQWLDTDRLQGLAGIVLTLDLEDPRFQGGPPQVTVRCRGHKLYDPRTGLTTFSANPALVARDYLASELGFGCANSEIDSAFLIAAANACDAVITFPDGTTGPTYTCHGTVTSDMAPERALDDIAMSMGGLIHQGASWLIMAGAWTAPVMDLVDDDLHGQIEIVQAGAGADDVVNGMRMTFVPVGQSVPDEPTPYQNAAFVASDGKPLWGDQELPFTNSRQRAVNIGRVITEQAHSALVIKYPAKLKAFGLQVGDRVRVKSKEYGFNYDTFRVTDWSFNITSPVGLVLEADAASHYDQADAVTATPVVQSSLPNPWVLTPLANLAAASGNNELLRLADGTVATRVRVTWTATTNAYMQGGRIVVRWRVAGSSTLHKLLGIGGTGAWREVAASGSDTALWIDGVSDGDTLVITAFAENSLGGRSTEVLITHAVVGKTAPPSNVASLTWATQEFGVLLSWPDVVDADVTSYELRAGGIDWDTATVLDANATSPWLWRVQTTGAKTVRVKAVDSSGNRSVTEATAAVNVTVPASPAMAWRVEGVNEVISWQAPTASFAIDHYELRDAVQGGSWAGATLLESTKALSVRRKVDFGGNRRRLVAAVDAAGNVGTPGVIDVTVAVPGAPTSGRAEVVDNNALLYWGAPAAGSLPVDRYEVRKGASWAGGTPIGSNGNSTFTAVFEQQSGLYTYQVAAYDSAGNLGPALPITATISQPPDYVLRTSWNSTLAVGNATNMVVESGSLVGPVNTTETWAQHFSTRGWASPQDQVNAGYPIYAQPSLTTATYDETFDYGAALSGTTVTATLGSVVITGAVTVACQIYTKLNVGDAWVAAAAGATSVLANNFRYVRVVWTFTCTAGANLIRVNSFNLKLAAKLRTDSGAGTSAVGGVAVAFGYAFIAADTPSVQAQGLDAFNKPYQEAVSYVGGANPTGFTVRIFNSAGTEVSGVGFSWVARGY